MIRGRSDHPAVQSLIGRLPGGCIFWPRLGSGFDSGLVRRFWQINLREVFRTVSVGRVRLLCAGVWVVGIFIVVVIHVYGHSLDSLSHGPGRIVPARYTEGGESRSNDEV